MFVFFSVHGISYSNYGMLLLTVGAKKIGDILGSNPKVQYFNNRVENDLNMGIRHQNATTGLFSHFAESRHLVTLPIPHDFYFQATWESSIIMGVHEHCKQREWNDASLVVDQSSV